VGNFIYTGQVAPTRSHRYGRRVAAGSGRSSLKPLRCTTGCRAQALAVSPCTVAKRQRAKNITNGKTSALADSIDKSEKIYYDDINEVEKIWADFRLAPIIVGVLTFCPAVISIGRIMAAAQGDTHTLLVLLDTLDIPPLVTTSLLSTSALPSATFLLTLIALKVSGKTTQTFLFGGIATGLIIGLGRIGIPTWAQGLLIAGPALGLIGARHIRKTLLNSTLTMGATLGAMVILTITTMSDTPWLPPEAIVVNGKPATTIYVLESQESGLVVLHRDRHVEFIQAANIATREFCYEPQLTEYLLYERTDIMSTNKNAPPLLRRCPK
jgi:hypothetical protein